MELWVVLEALYLRLSIVLLDLLLHNPYASVIAHSIFANLVQDLKNVIALPSEVSLADLKPWTP